MQTYIFYELLIYNFFQQLNYQSKYIPSVSIILLLIWIYRVTVLDLGITHMTVLHICIHYVQYLWRLILQFIYF